MFGIDSDVKTKGEPVKGRRFCRFTFVMMCLLVVIVYQNPRKVADEVNNGWDIVSNATINGTSNIPWINNDNSPNTTNDDTPP